MDDFKMLAHNLLSRIFIFELPYDSLNLIYIAHLLSKYSLASVIFVSAPGLWSCRDWGSGVNTSTWSPEEQGPTASRRSVLRGDSMATVLTGALKRNTISWEL